MDQLQLSIPAKPSLRADCQAPVVCLLLPMLWLLPGAHITGDHIPAGEKQGGGPLGVIGLYYRACMPLGSVHHEIHLVRGGGVGAEVSCTALV